MYQMKVKKRLDWIWVVLLFGCILLNVSWALGAETDNSLSKALKNINGFDSDWAPPVTFPQTFDKVAPDEMYLAGKMQPEEINARIAEAKYFSLVQNYLQDKFINFLVGAGHKFEPSGNPIDVPMDTTGFTWSGPDPDGWYTYLTTAKPINDMGDETAPVKIVKIVKFKSANANNIRLKVMLHYDMDMIGTADLSATRGSNDLWSGVYHSYTIADYTDRSSDDRYYLYLVEQFRDADLTTGAGNYEVKAAFEVPNEESFGITWHTLATSYSVNSSRVFTATSSEALKTQSDDLVSEWGEPYSGYDSVKRFNLVLSCVWDKFDNFLASGDHREFVPSGEPIFIKTTSFLEWFPDSDGWYTAAENSSNDKGSEIRKVLRIKTPSENEINLTAAVTEDCHDGQIRTSNYVLAVTKGENGWNGSLQASGEDFSGAVSPKCTWTFSAMIQDVDLNKGSGTYQDITATVNLPGKSIGLTADYVCAFDAGSAQQIRLTGAQILGGNTNYNVDETYTIVGITSSQINTLLYSLGHIGLVENYVSDKFANFLDNGSFTLGRSRTSPLWPFAIPILANSAWTLDASNSNPGPHYTSTRNITINGTDYMFKMGYWQESDEDEDEDDDLAHLFEIKLFLAKDGVVNEAGNFQFQGNIEDEDIWDAGGFIINDSGIQSAVQGAAVTYNITSFLSTFGGVDFYTGQGVYLYAGATFEIPAQSKSYFLTSVADEGPATVYYVKCDLPNSRYLISGQDTFNGIKQTVNDIYRNDNIKIK